MPQPTPFREPRPVCEWVTLRYPCLGIPSRCLPPTHGSVVSYSDRFGGHRPTFTSKQREYLHRSHMGSDGGTVHRLTDRCCTGQLTGTLVGQWDRTGIGLQTPQECLRNASGLTSVPRHRPGYGTDTIGDFRSRLHHWSIPLATNSRLRSQYLG